MFNMVIRNQKTLVALHRIFFIFVSENRKVWDIFADIINDIHNNITCSRGRIMMFERFKYNISKSEYSVNDKHKIIFVNY